MSTRTYKILYEKAYLIRNIYLLRNKLNSNYAYVRMVIVHNN